MERMIFLGLVGGLRLGECCALRRSQVDWRSGRMSVQKPILDVPGFQGQEKETKNYRQRDVYCDSDAMVVLREQLAFIERRAAQAGVDIASDPYLWSNEVDSSEPLLPRAVTQYFDRLRDRVNLPHVSFKSLRSTVAANA
jgi:integrase